MTTKRANDIPARKAIGSARHVDRAAPSVVARPPAAASRRLPSKSVRKAASIFKAFSPSRFTAETRPANHLPSHLAKDPLAVQKLQRKLMAEQLKAVPKIDPVNPGATIGLSQVQLAKLLPSYKPESGAVDLSELLTVLRQRMNGTEFYAGGAPPLIQSARQSRLQSTVKLVIQSIKDRGTPA